MCTRHKKISRQNKKTRLKRWICSNSPRLRWCCSYLLLTLLTPLCCGSVHAAQPARSAESFCESAKVAAALTDRPINWLRDSLTQGCKSLQLLSTAARQCRTVQCITVWCWPVTFKWCFARDFWKLLQHNKIDLWWLEIAGFALLQTNKCTGSLKPAEEIYSVHNSAKYKCSLNQHVLKKGLPVGAGRGWIWRT